MTSEFLMDNGAGVVTHLWRTAGTGRRYIWRDGPPGDPYALQFDDERGRPVDVFGLPLDGKFIEPSTKNT